MRENLRRKELKKKKVLVQSPEFQKKISFKDALGKDLKDMAGESFKRMMIRDEMRNRNRNTENAIEVSRSIAGICPVKVENIGFIMEKQNIENGEAEKKVAIEYIKNYLGMETVSDQIVMTKVGKSDSLYV